MYISCMCRVYFMLQVVPSTLQFVQQSGCGCSVAEVLRMERRVLDILGWNLRLVTPLDFLHVVSARVLKKYPFRYVLELIPNVLEMSVPVVSEMSVPVVS